MNQPTYSPTRPHQIGLECPRCGRLNWIDAIKNYSASGDSFEELAFTHCKDCQAERRQAVDNLSEIDQRGQLAYPVWSPVLGPDVVLHGELLEE